MSDIQNATEQPAAQPEPPRTITFGNKQMSVTEAENAIRSSGNWFWWIAALSVVNSVATVLQLKYGMVLGLGLTQVFDAVVLLDENGTLNDASLGVHLVHAALVLGTAWLFVRIGVHARAQSVKAFKFGMAIYALDGLIFLVVGDWIGVGFHVFVLFFLWGGLGIARTLATAKQSYAGSAV
jgi:hypothetical protein